MDTLLQDIRYTTRKLLRTPGFTFIAVATLALAIGSTTAIFSIINGVLLKPLPFEKPDQVVLVASTSSRDAGNSPVPMSGPDFMDYKEQSRSFVGMAPYQANPVNLTGDGTQPVRLQGAQVGANFFDLLGVRAARGRTFAQGEDAQGAPRVAVLSDRLWQKQFGGDPRIVGQTITLDGNVYTVVGIAPASLNFPARTEIYLPYVFPNYLLDPSNRGAHSFMAIARVRDGIPVETASRELATIAARLAKQYPESNTGFGAVAVPLQERIIGNVDRPLYAMFGAVAFVLLIACANVANLLLVRASARESEMAVRTALGAGRGRIVRQLVTESVMLSLAGAVVGSAMAAWAVDAVVAFGPRGLPRLDEVVIDGRVLLFTGGVAVLTGMLFGLVPALHAARPDIAQMLRESVRGSSRGGTHRTRSALVITEMALAVVLLVGAGLLIRSFVRLIGVDPGFRPENVVAFNVSLPDSKYPLERDARAFVQSVSDRLRQAPGVSEVGVVFGRPLEQGAIMRTGFEIEGQPPSTPNNRRIAEVHPATPSFFRAMGIPLVRGRVYTEDENRLGGPPAVVISQALANKFFPNEDPMGKLLTFGITHDTAATGQGAVTVAGRVVGVVGDIRQRDLTTDYYPTAYVPYNTFPIGFVSFVIRSTADAQLVQTAAKAAVREVDHDLPMFNLTTMKQAVSDSVAQPRFYMMLLGAFAVIALLLAALGIYGVISYTVSQRTRELGIRIALGASRQKVERLVIGQGVWLTAAGIAIGVVAATFLTRVIASMMFGVEQTDPVTFAVVPITLVAVAMLASWLPARRASRVDPVIAMRND
jgi:putative ABC transport system permease protein